MGVPIAKADGCPCEPGPQPVNRGRRRDLVAAGVPAGTYVPLLHYEAPEYGPQLITLFVTQANTFGPNGGTDESSPLARVRYGVGGVIDDFEVDFARGTSFVINAESIDIDAQLQASPLEFQSMVVGAMVQPAEGSAANHTAAVNTRSFPVVSIGAAATVAYVIPKFARGFYLFAEADSSYVGSTTLRWFADQQAGAAGRLLYARDLATATPGIGAQAVNHSQGGWGFPPNARSVDITNAGAGARVFVPVFYLSL